MHHRRELQNCIALQKHPRLKLLLRPYLVPSADVFSEPLRIKCYNLILAMLELANGPEGSNWWRKRNCPFRPRIMTAQRHSFLSNRRLVLAIGPVLWTASIGWIVVTCLLRSVLGRRLIERTFGFSRGNYGLIYLGDAWVFWIQAVTWDSPIQLSHLGGRFWHCPRVDGFTFCMLYGKKEKQDELPSL